MPKKIPSKKTKLFGNGMTIFSSTVVALILVILLFFVVNAFRSSIQRSHETRAFASLKQSIHMVSNNINMTLGHPTKYKINNYCDRTSEVFTDGTPYCVIEIGGNLPAFSTEDAKGKADQIRSILLDDTRIRAKTQPEDTVTNGFWEQKQSLEYKTSESNFKIGCSLTFNFLPSTSVDSSFDPGDKMPGTLGYSLYCREYTAAVYY